jgi:hypothetical protein
MAFIPAIMVVWHQMILQIAAHPRPGRCTYAAVLNSAALQYGFVFAAQCLLVVQALAWPVLKGRASWTPEWWQSEALAWMLILLAHWAGPLVVLVVGIPHFALFLWRRWRARVRRSSEAPLQSFG